MARPKKNNADYFPHDADMRNDVKVKALRRRFSHTGYAVWCYLLETLTASDFFEIDYRELSQELYAADFDITSEQLREIVDYCCKIDLLQLSEDGTRLYCEAHQRRFSMLINKRERDRERLQRLIEERQGGKKTEDSQSVNEAKTGISPSSRADNPHSKVKESKGKESKEKESKDSSTASDKIHYPYQDIVALWNEVCPMLPKVQKLTDDRRAKIKARLCELSKDSGEWMAKCRELFERVAASDFLTGSSKNGWTASFDWIFTNSKNWVKVMEGNYDNDRGRHGSNGGAQAGVRLGVGEFIEQGTNRRTYGSGTATIPMSAPPRPSERHAWNESTKQWVLL